MAIVALGRTVMPLSLAVGGNIGAAKHRQCANDERGAEQDLESMLRDGALSQEVHREGAEESAGERAVTEVFDQSRVHRLLSPVDEDTSGLHEEGRHEVRRDGSCWGDPEDEDQHRCHEGPTAHAREANEETYDGASEHQVKVDVHASP